MYKDKFILWRECTRSSSISMQWMFAFSESVWYIKQNHTVPKFFSLKNEAFLKIMCKSCPLWDVSVQFLFVNMCSAVRCLWVTCPQVETEHLTTRRRKSNRLSWEFGKLKGQDKWSTPSNEEIKEIPSDSGLVKESILHYAHEWFPSGFRVNLLHAFYLPFQIWMVVTMI